MDPINDLVSYVVKARYEDLPEQLVHVVKKSIIDTLAVCIAGSTAQGVKTLVDLTKEWGGREQSSIMVYGGRVPAPNAALVNCTMARALDFDDVHATGGGHLSVTTVPCSLVIAEYSQKPISGKDFILANVLCSELNCRLRMASRYPIGWLTDTVSPLGIVAMGGKLLGFDEEQMINAMGIAYSQCSCNAQANLDGALTVRLQQGLSAKAGVLALILAERGFTGAKNVLQGKYGLYPLYYRGQYDQVALLGDLGKRFEAADISVKLYSSCLGTHGPIDCTLELMRERGIKCEEIEEIIVISNSYFQELLLGSENTEGKFRPQSIVDAQFSMPYTVAIAAVKGRVNLSDFTEESISDPKVLEMAAKVKIRVDRELDKIPGIVLPKQVEIKTRNGQRHSKHLEFLKGDPRNPVTMTGIADKLRDCAHLSAVPLSERKIGQLLKIVARLEELDDVTKLIAILSP